jgi:long-chain acyl-CoA synthetase
MIIPDYVERYARLYPERTAVIFEDRQCTYLELQERVYRLANGLIKLGLKEDDRVAVLSENCFEFLEIYTGVAKAGGVVAPLNYRLLPKDITQLVSYVDTEFLIVGANYVDMIHSIRANIQGVKHLIALGGGGKGMIDYDQLLAASPPNKPEVKRGMDDLFCLIFTGGTTGFPKGAMLTHRNLYNTALSFIVGTQIAHGDVHLVVTPLFHTGALWPLFIHLILGNTQVVLRRVDVNQIVEAIEKWKVTYSMWVASIIGLILNHPDVVNRKRDISSMRLINTGGAPLPTVLVKKVIDILGCTLTNGGGQTETGIFTSMKYNDYIDSHPERMASAGLPIITNMEFKIVDENDHEVPPGIIGELVVRGDSMMKGYWNMPEETAVSMRGGWQHTGDLCKVDNDGFLYYMDRKKDMIKSGGENVYSKEVEDVLYAYPDILEAAVIGVPDEKWGEMVKALVVLKEGKHATDQDIIAYCKTRLAGFKCPKSVVFVDHLPKTAMGKADKATLRKQYQ